MPDTDKLNEQPGKEQPGTDDTQKKTVEPGTDGTQPDGKENTDGNDANSEIAKLKASLEKYKAAITKTAKEAADYKRQLRAKQSKEEIDAEDQREKGSFFDCSVS